MSDASIALSPATAGGVLMDANAVVRGPSTLYQERVEIAKLAGAWGYYAGVSGTVVIGIGQRVIGIAAHATTAGSMIINGGASVPIPANVGISVQPAGNLVAPSIVFTGTDSYFVETLA